MAATYPALNAARRVGFLVTGEEKAERVREVLEPDKCVGRTGPPAARVRPEGGRVVWVVDEAAMVRP